jgi:hypothetical protein
MVGPDFREGASDFPLEPAITKISPYIYGTLRRPEFEPRSGHLGFVAVKVALGQDFSEYVGFPFHLSFHRLLQTHHLSSGAGTIGELVVDAPSGLSSAPSKETKNKYIHATLCSRLALCLMIVKISHF